MRNIRKLIEELVKKQVIPGAVGDYLYNFISHNGGMNDVEESDVINIVAKITDMKFGTGLNLNDEWLPQEHKRKTNILLAEACLRRDFAPMDVSKVFAIYIEICEVNMLHQT